jgi:hypothetical protein
VKPIYKFNNGNGATICNRCRTIIATGKKVDKLYCNNCQNEIDKIEAFYKAMEKEVHNNKNNLNK